MKKLKLIFFVLCSALLLTGCRVAEQHPFFAVGNVYETKVEAFALFKYAAFIWQDKRDYQECGYLLPFVPWEAYQERQQKIKQAKATEVEPSCGGLHGYGGWAFYIPIGTRFKITEVYSHIPRVDKTVCIDAVFLDGPAKGRNVSVLFFREKICKLDYPDTMLKVNDEDIKK